MAVTVSDDFTLIAPAEGVSAYIPSQDSTAWTNVGTWDDDAKVQGHSCATARATTGATDVYHTLGGAVNLNSPAGQHVFIWANLTTAPGMDVKANGGLRVVLATTSLASNVKKWNVDGKDTRLTGGWECYVVDPNSAEHAVQTGTYNPASHLLTGIECNYLGSVKSTARNLWVDAARRGTGFGVICSAGSVAALSDLIAYENTLDASASPGPYRIGSYGVVSQLAGIYFLAGRIRVGTAAQAAATSFKETSKVVVFKDFPVATTFYGFTLAGAASYLTTLQFGDYAGGVASNGCIIKAAGTRVWDLIVGANSKALLYASVIDRLRTATLGSTSEMRGCTVTNSGTIDTNGAVISGCSFAAHTATQLQLDAAADSTNLSGCKFTSGGTGHAIEITAAGDYTFDALTFSGYAGADGSTGNEAIKVSAASGTVNISLQNGTAQPSVYKVNAGCTVAFPTSATIKVTNLVTGSQVLITKSSDGTVLYNGGLTGANECQQTLSYVGEVIVEVRKATAAPYYQPWTGYATTAAGVTVTVKALQVTD